MSEIVAVRVVPFAPNEYTPADKTGPALFTWQQYYSFRNEIVEALRRYGTVGPMGVMPILEEWELADSAWQAGDPKPKFFVVSDMWSDRSRWSRVEADPWAINLEALFDLLAIARRWPDWCVYLALVQGGLMILADRILFEGDLFAGSSSVEDLAQRCALTKPIQLID